MLPDLHIGFSRGRSGGLVFQSLSESNSRKLETPREHLFKDGNKDRNSRDLMEAEDIKKRWQEYTEELYKNDLQDQDNHDGMV